MKKLLDWSNYHDQGMGDAYADIPKHGGNFAKAISVCIRSGVCQESNNRGVMCPSFRLNEQADLSPGGRVAQLKQLLNQDDSSFLSDPKLAEMMESCVSCKGCKRECENNLDMAAIKAEYLAQKRQAGHSSLRAWLFAEFPFLLYRFPLLGRLIKWRNSSSLLAKFGEKLFKVNGQIPLPEPSKKPYFDSFKQRQRNSVCASLQDNERCIVLLIDSFTALFHPQVAKDAIKVLQAAGYHVITLHPKSDTTSEHYFDSGRSLFSQGYMQRANQQASELVNKLKDHIKLGHRVVGLEPSALLMLRDEFLMMNLGLWAEKVAKQTYLFEEFVAREKNAGRFNAKFKSADQQKILVHGHCHQKAVGAMKSVRKVMRLVPEIDFEFIEASCCGMAGSFGLQAENKQESLAMAELGLLPALDKAPEALVVCNGFSCSHQILATRGRKALHLASLLAKHLQS